MRTKLAAGLSRFERIPDAGRISPAVWADHFSGWLRTSGLHFERGEVLSEAVEHGLRAYCVFFCAECGVPPSHIDAVWEAYRAGGPTSGRAVERVQE
jgi:hypothetical protein